MNPLDEVADATALDSVKLFDAFLKMQQRAEDAELALDDIQNQLDAFCKWLTRRRHKPILSKIESM